MNRDLSTIISVFDEFFTLIYKKKIDELILNYPQKRSLYIDYGEFQRFNVETADALLTNPDIIIEGAETTIEEMNVTLPSGLGVFAPHVRFYGLPESDLYIEHLSSKNLSGLVTVKGVVTRRADVLHKVQLGVYKCTVCDSVFKIPITRGFVAPRRCENCRKLALKQVEEETKFIDVQRGEMQELLERVRGGSPAAKIELWMEDDLVNVVSPGDTVEITGILRLKQLMRGRGEQDLIYGRYLDVMNIKSLQRDFEEIDITEEDERRIKELSEDPLLEQKIYTSVAPAIYGHDEVKQALVLQLFGGTKGKILPAGGRVRDDIHILLIGDPGISKTRFLQNIEIIAPKSVYVSGKSVSGVGLTAAAERDELSGGGWTLKAGALVLASGGIASIDEFDKIDVDERAVLHEVMENQTISLAKAGIVAKFRAKTSVLAAANPKFGRFDLNRPLGEQFDIPPSLLSRFDLIFPIVDVLDEEKDSQLAEHILTTHARVSEQPPKEKIQQIPISTDLLRKYIAHARRHIHPKLSKDAHEKIKDFYVELRKRGKSSGAVPITPRYLEAILRLSEARAKMFLREEVIGTDAEKAIALMTYVLSKIMTDRETGRIDIDIVSTGKSKSQRDKVYTILNIIKEILKEYEMAEIKKIVEEAKQYDIDEQTARRIIYELLRGHNAELYEPKSGFVKFIPERE